MAHAISLFAGLAMLWLLLSGIYDSVLILSFGLLSCLVALLIARRMETVDRESVPIHLGLGLVVYWSWLIKEIFKANLDVALRILSPRMPVSPQLIRLKSTQKTDLGKVIYANAITLTPGTVTLDIEGEYLVVHAIAESAADDLAGGEMDRRTTKWEGND